MGNLLELAQLVRGVQARYGRTPPSLSLDDANGQNLAPAALACPSFGRARGTGRRVTQRLYRRFPLLAHFRGNTGIRHSRRMLAWGRPPTARVSAQRQGERWHSPLQANAGVGEAPHRARQRAEEVTGWSNRRRGRAPGGELGGVPPAAWAPMYRPSSAWSCPRATRRATSGPWAGGSARPWGASPPS